MKLVLTFILFSLAGHAQAAEAEVLACKSSEGRSLNYNNTYGELIAYSKSGKATTDEEYLVLGDSKRVGNIEVTDIVHDTGRYVVVAQILKSPKKVLIVFENDTFDCK